MAPGDKDGRNESGAGAPKPGRAGPKVFSFFFPLNGKIKSHNLGRTLRAGVCWELFDLAQRRESGGQN